MRTTTRLLLAAVLLSCAEPPPSAAEAPVLAPPVDYLATAPVVDGLLDPELAGLPVRPFPVVWKSAETNPEVPCRYRIAYGASFLYLHVEAEAESLVCRDRAYQNGDGITLVLAVPRDDEKPSEDFHVLACSAVDRPQMEWSRKVFWYYNVDHLFLPVSDATRVAARAGDGTIAFEVLLPWTEVHPHHPWLAEGVGFNLGFTKAIGENERTIHQVLDAAIGSENSPRETLRLDFAPPEHAGPPASFLLPEAGSLARGRSLGARVVTVASTQDAVRLRMEIRSGEGERVERWSEDLAVGPGLTRQEVLLPTGDLPAGGYRLRWSTQAGAGENGLTILPPFDPPAVRQRIAEAAEVLAPSSSSTLELWLEEIEAAAAGGRSYETRAATRLAMGRTLAALEAADGGEDLLARRRGFVRRAHRSARDGSLQPYLLWVPEDFDPGRSHPLMVHLHGSASTEEDLRGAAARIPGGFLAVAPFGRGPSNWYSWDGAQEDIAEVVEAVCAELPVDRGRILLSGFSMGGYGVYRTWWETPGRWRALAVFSGGPRVRFGVPEGIAPPDFRRPENLQGMEGVPVFVYHGRRDRNIPFAETEAFVERLRAAGAAVDFVVEDDRGHESPGPEALEAYRRWVARVLAP